METNVIYLEKEFRAYMKEEGMDPRSISSYVSDLKRLFDILSKINPEALKILNNLPSLLATNPNSAIELLSRMLSYLENNKNVTGLPPKKVADCRSELKKYIQFLMTLISDEYDFSQNNTIRLLSRNQFKKLSALIPWILDHDAIYDKFILRMITWDRLTGSNKVYYPISLIKKLFYHSPDPKDREWFDNWIKESIDEINVIVSGNVIWKVKDVSFIEIKPNGDVHATTFGNQKEQVYTRTKVGDLRPMKASDFSDISIDHKPPIDDILRKFADDLKGLKALTCMLKCFAKCMGGIDLNKNKKMINNAFFDHCFDALILLMPYIKEDLELIRKNTDLILMEKKENISKGNR